MESNSNLNNEWVTVEKKNKRNYHKRKPKYIENSNNTYISQIPFPEKQTSNHVNFINTNVNTSYQIQKQDQLNATKKIYEEKLNLYQSELKNISDRIQNLMGLIQDQLNSLIISK